MTAPATRGTGRTRAARTARGVANVLLAVLVVIGVAYAAAGPLGYQRYVITGGSMSGSIEKGSLAFSRPVPVEDLEVGDVITYLPPPDAGVYALVTHRITGIEVDVDGVPFFTTQGDANADPDPWVFALDRPTQPVVQFSVPTAGYFFLALTDRSTRMLVIGVPAAVIALISLVDVVRAARRAPLSTATAGA